MSIDIDMFTKTVEDMPDNKSIAILLHMFPDPDAMGAGLAMKFLLMEKFGRDSHIYHLGEVSHPQNKAMKNVLKIEMRDASTLQDPAGIIVLDGDAGNLGIKISHIDIRIDHHKAEKNGATYCDRRLVGSCCSIIWEYIQALDIDLVGHEDVATALVIGIETDTLRFTSTDTKDLDYEAYGKLIPYTDRTMLAKVNRFTLPKAQFEKEVIAFENLELQGPIATSFVGEVNEYNRDIISMVADRFSRMETVSTVVIMGVVENHLVASVRSEDTRHDVKALCTKAFGKDFSGTKEDKGGARVPLGIGFNFLEGEFKQQAIKEAIKGFRIKILEALGE